MSNPQVKAIEDYQRLRNRNAQTQAIRTAVKLGIIKALREGQKTSIQLAEETGCQTQALELLMAILITTELVQQYDQDYALSQIGRLIPDQFLDFGDAFWDQLPGYLQSGVSIHNDPTLDQTEFDFVVQKATEEWMQTPIALDAAKILGIGEHRKGQKILEVACGSAVFGATIAHKDPTAQVVLLDTPEGLQRAEKTIESVGLEGKITTVEVDDLNDMIGADVEPNSFDVVLATNFLHTRSPQACRTFFQSVNAWLTQTGELVLVDIFPGQDEGDLSRVVMEMELALRTGAGQLHDPNLLKEMLKECGFSHVQYAHLPSTPHLYGLLLAG